MWVKICGITRWEDAWLAAGLGAAAVGFVFWPGSRRSIEPMAAGDIVRRLPASVTPVGVFVNQPAEHVNAVAQALGLGAVQLHGAETPGILCADYDAHHQGRAGRERVPRDGGSRSTRGRDGAARCRRSGGSRWNGPGGRLDGRAGGGTQRRTILAGGLTPENVVAAIRTVEPDGVDVSSGVESKPGVKDHRRLRRFFDAINSSVVGGRE